MTDKKKKKQIMVSHGNVTHKFGADCKDCYEVEVAFEKALESGKVDRMLKLKKGTTLKQWKGSQEQHDYTQSIKHKLNQKQDSD